MSVEANIRAAEALLRTNGGRSVLLRIPQPPVAGDPAEDLGLSTPTFHDIELAPAAFRKAGSTSTLLIAAESVARAVGAIQAGSAESLFSTAVGIVIDDTLFRIASATAQQAFGAAYCYTLSLTA